MNNSSMEKYIKRAKIAGIPTPNIRTNTPSQFADRQHQYYADANRLYTERIAKYSTDYVVALAQGLDPNDPFEYKKVHMRIANIIRAASAISFSYDNYKMIEIAEKQYSYIRKGSKVKTMGSTWLVINPDNMSGVQGKCVIQRCDAVWNHLDYYGNIISEPICVDRLDMRGVDPDSQRATMINTGYFQFKMQYNENTAQLGNNSRLLVGGDGFRIAGYSDFHREYTDEDDSIQMLVFRAMFEEPNAAIDDLEHSVAGGKTFAWNITVSGTPALRVGDTAQLHATSKRTAEEHTNVVTNTKEHPIYYLWESSDESVATVDIDGNVTAVSEGEAVITCILAQNQDKTAEFDITVAGDATEPHVDFASTPPTRLHLFEEATLTAEYYENGQAVDGAEIEFIFSGANQDAYTATVSGNTITIKCWGGSVESLYVNAEYNGYGTGFTVQLEGI